MLGTDGRQDVANAAFLNCFSSAVHTFDDTHLASIVHPTGPVAAAAAIAMRERVVAVADPGCAADQVSALITLRDKRTLASRVTSCRGSIDRPLTDDELAQKFLAQADPVLEAGPARHLLDLCRNCAGLEDVGAISRAAQPAAT